MIKIDLINLELLSKYRTPLMGFSALLIIICHASSYHVEMPPVVRFLLSFGNVGVDIFLFLSGIGLWYSLNQGNRGRLSKWYKKRFVRIFIPYVLIQIPFWGFSIIKGNFDLIDSLYEFSTIAFWVRHTGMWYVALLIPLYLLTPFLYKLLESTSHRIKLVIFLMILVLILCNLDIYSENNLAMNVIKNIQWAFGRTVSFIIGMAIAPVVKQGVKVNGLYIVLTTIILVPTLRLLGFGYYWSLFAVMVLCFVKILDYLSLKGRTYSFLQFMGVISLESYLSNVYLKNTLMQTSWYNSDSPLLYGHYFDYVVLVFIGGILLSFIVHKISAKIFCCIKY